MIDLPLHTSAFSGQGQAVPEFPTFLFSCNKAGVEDRPMPFGTPMSQLFRIRLRNDVSRCPLALKDDL